MWFRKAPLTGLKKQMADFYADQIVIATSIAASREQWGDIPQSARDDLLSHFEAIETWRHTWSSAPAPPC